MAAAAAMGTIFEGILAALHDDFADRVKQCLALWAAALAAADASAGSERGDAWLNAVAAVRSSYALASALPRYHCVFCKHKRIRWVRVRSVL